MPSDAIAGLVYAIQTGLNGSSQDAAWAGQRAHDAADHVAMSRLDASLIGKDEEAVIRSDAFVQAELERQQADLADLKLAAMSESELDAAIVRLRERARVDSQAIPSKARTR